jgi:hypothetical protein
MKLRQDINSSYHPFRSAEAKEKYLKLYDLRAKKWPVVSESRMVDTSSKSSLRKPIWPLEASSQSAWSIPLF